MRGCVRARARGDSVVAGLHVLAGCLRSPSTPMTLVFGGGGGLESVCVCVTPLGRCVYVCVCSPSSGGVLYIALHAIFRIYYRLRPIHRGISPRTAASWWVGKKNGLPRPRGLRGVQRRPPPRAPLLCHPPVDAAASGFTPPCFARGFAPP